MAASHTNICIGNYLLERLKQLGVTKMFGVPGDFTLGFLDLVEDCQGIDWVGNCNELNASYAADGYARVKETSIGVVSTTFGVGELSAMNGIAGAFSEHVPVLHLVGVPSTVQWKAKPMLHHTLGDGRFDAYTKASSHVTISQAAITNTESAASEIDRVLTACITAARPVYLTLPTDMVYLKISAEPLKTPIKPIWPQNNVETEKFVLDDIMKLIAGAGDQVVILADACAIRHHVRMELGELIQKTGFPVYAAPMGKSVVGEDYERYGGIYVGSISHPDVKEKVESAKVVISVGAIKSDFNTANFTYNIPEMKYIELHSQYAKVQYAHFEGIGMKDLLPKLTASIVALNSPSKNAPVPKLEAVIPQDASQEVTQEYLWPRVSKFFQSKDVILTETGTSSFGMLDVPLPSGAVYLTQILYGSIGWAGGSTLGAAFAAKECGLGRTLLFIGDGSLQLTGQELSSMIRHGLTPTIFVLNNDGYVIERFLHGPTRKYNDIQPWRWTSLLNVFGGEEGKTCKSYTVRTRTELSTLLDDPAFAKSDKIQLVEIIMPRLDAPRSLKATADLSSKSNKYAPT
ncbi:pyruvate decarboxylase [Rickenella mellea]|uniref:Pyruvate decarboxylase n=1 Tax=Rickenella mellea TaxID=50990 RepID=A0A4Y7QMM8_9AGAM|nr:pyruvate decarboxylase [Rickenella mellea]